MLPRILLLAVLSPALLGNVRSAECDDRPAQLVNAEGYCADALKDQEGLFERVESKAKSLFDRARKELGFKQESKAEAKKCGYYKCIFERLGMLNQLDLPDLSLMQVWITENMEEPYKSPQVRQVAMCFRMLATSAYNVQNNCEIATHIMMCLHSTDECQVFLFP